MNLTCWKKKKKVIESLQIDILRQTVSLQTDILCQTTLLWKLSYSRFVARSVGCHGLQAMETTSKASCSSSWMGLGRWDSPTGLPRRPRALLPHENTSPSATIEGCISHTHVYTPLQLPVLLWHSKMHHSSFAHHLAQYSVQCLGMKHLGFTILPSTSKALYLWWQLLWTCPHIQPYWHGDLSALWLGVAACPYCPGLAPHDPAAQTHWSPECKTPQWLQQANKWWLAVHQLCPIHIIWLLSSQLLLITDHYWLTGNSSGMPHSHGNSLNGLPH